MENALETRIDKWAGGDRHAVPWMVMHAATAINEGRQDDGVLPRRMRKGKEFAKP